MKPINTVRFLIAAGVIAALLPLGLRAEPTAVPAKVAAAPVEDAKTYRVVAAGDSILFIVAMSGLYMSSDRWGSTEPGRDIYDVGLANWYSMNTILPVLVAKSRPGGWVVVQDNGGRSTVTKWRAMWAKYAATIPDDRCILAIVPANTSPAAMVEQSKLYAFVMMQELGKQPCHRFIRWDTAVVKHPALMSWDGTHPSPAGARWLARAIDDIVGYRVN